MSRRRKEESSGPGRPSNGIAEARLNIRLPESLIGAMQRLASEQEISASEAWRRAARAYLGLENRLPEDE